MFSHHTSQHTRPIVTVLLSLGLILITLWLLGGSSLPARAWPIETGQSAAPLVPSTILTVTNADDDGPGSLRQAIADAANGDIINFDNGYSIYLSSTLEITKQLTIDGSVYTITVSGDTGNDGTRDVQVFNIGTKSVVTLDHLNIVSGQAIFGGGLYVATGAQVAVLSSTLSDNRSFDGGAIHNEGTLNVMNSTLAANISQGNGGAIANRGTLALSNATLISNIAPFYGCGGGIHNLGALTVTNSILVSNTAASCGGGIVVDGGARAVVQNSTLASNTAAVGGGLENGYTLLIANTTLAGNTATKNGGGLYNRGTLTATNSTFSGNITQGMDGTYEGGGAIDQWGQFPAPIPNALLINVTFADNDAPNVAQRDGIWLERGNMILHNVLLVHNGTSSCTIEAAAMLTVTNDSMSNDATCVGATSTPTLTLPSLAANDGRTPTHALLPGNPAIDAGDDTTCLPTDQRGVARPQGSHCDIGAYELAYEMPLSTWFIYLPAILR